MGALAATGVVAGGSSMAAKTADMNDSVAAQNARSARDCACPASGVSITLGVNALCCDSSKADDDVASGDRHRARLLGDTDGGQPGQLGEPRLLLVDANAADSARCAATGVVGSSASRSALSGTGDHTSWKEAPAEAAREGH